ncbi:uncharacterized protein LOC116616677 [Nematostella vectensis]|uniref:uncharacterized protein LOC116616677 n=1 Tax=Nematostella vectensis TaxID=45351 RepID=UPI00207706EC|nr:uncharacterized protein LOC116616677 [Nematostella vectensis]
MKFAKVCLAVLVLTVCVCVRGSFGGKCEKSGKTRSTEDKCSGMPCYHADSRLARAAGIREGSLLCLAHRNEATKEDNRCSFPLSSPSQTHISSLRDLPSRLYDAVDALGKENIPKYRSGTKWCSACKRNGEATLKEKVPEKYVPPAKRQCKKTDKPLTENECPTKSKLNKICMIATSPVLRLCQSIQDAKDNLESDSVTVTRLSAILARLEQNIRMIFSRMENLNARQTIETKFGLVEIDNEGNVQIDSSV